jgi:REP element-mobilizing transposase RayT
VTAPRRIVTDATYLVTRRCSERRMFMRPSPDLNRLLLYLLAVSVERFGVLLHGYCFLSNHFHLVVTDPRGVLPAFEQYLASLIARSCNALIGHRESFWSPGSYSAVTLLEQGDVLDKLAYTLANPSSAGLVRRGADWPGLWSSPEVVGGPAVEVERPEFFFRSEGPMPDRATLGLVAPPGVEDLQGFRRSLGAELTRLEDEAAERLASAGRTFLGVQGVLEQAVWARPAQEEPSGRLNPRVACKDPERRRDALLRLKAFLLAYREAWTNFAGGVRDWAFPHGTYWMRVAYAVPCMPDG